MNDEKTFDIEEESTDELTGSSGKSLDRRADIVYVIDCTRSMDSTDEYGIPLISALKESIEALVLYYKKEEVSIKLGLTEFRDKKHTNDVRYGRSLLTQYEWNESYLTSNLDDFSSAINGLEAAGGGPDKESILDALVTTAENVDWTEGAYRIIVLFTDTSPYERDVEVKSKLEAVERLRTTGINQLHLCINEKLHGLEYDDFLQINELDSSKEVTEIHNIIHKNMDEMISFLKNVHKGSVNRVIGSTRYGRGKTKGRTRRRKPPVEPPKNQNETEVNSSAVRIRRYRSDHQ